VNAQQQQHMAIALAALGACLKAGTEQGVEPGTAIGGGLAQQANQTRQVLAEKESEIDREIARLRAANEALQEVVDALWSKLSSVTAPPRPSDQSTNTAVPACASTVGNLIQNEAYKVYGFADNLRYLTESLAT